MDQKMMSIPITIPFTCEEGINHYPVVGVIREESDPDTGEVFYSFEAKQPRGAVARVAFFMPQPRKDAAPMLEETK